MTGAQVRVEPAIPAEQALIAGLLQFYVYDFSELEPEGSDNLDFGPDGRFQTYERLPLYWTEPGRRALLIRVGGKPAGFALVNVQSHLGRPVDHNMAEFFVARKYRRRGVATEAMHQLIGMYPGRWEVAVLARNLGALAFWPRAIAAGPGVERLVRHDGGAGDWEGPVWTFEAAGRIGGLPPLK